MSETSKISKPRQKRAEITREKIIQAGMKLFFRDGYYNTSSKKIAKEAKIAIGSFYNHFIDKKALLIEVIQRHMQEIHDVVFDGFKNVNLREMHGNQFVKFIIQQSIGAHNFTPEFHREIDKLAYIDDDIHKLHAIEKERIIGLFVSLLEERKAELRVTDIRAASTVVVTAVEETIHQFVLFESSIEKDRILTELSDMIFRYLYK